jgi:cell division protein FtsW (lipid II flippase)
LPLISYGGSSLLTTLVLVGMLEAVHIRGRLAGAR